MLGTRYVIGGSYDSPGCPWRSCDYRNVALAAPVGMLASWPDVPSWPAKLLDTSDFPARWNCGHWSALDGWVHIVADLAIWGAYTSIPILLVYFLHRYRIPFPRVTWLFAAFILSCGLTHLIDAVIFWWPIYRVSALMKVVTAAISWGTVVSLLCLAPRALTLPRLKRANLELQRMLRERGARARASEEQLRLMVNAVNEYAVIMLDPNGLITSWNPGAQRIKGYSREEALGQHFSRFYAEADLAEEAVEQKLALAVSAGKHEESRWLLRKDGSRFFANVVISAVYDEGGNLRGFANVTRDITAARRDETKFRTLLEAAPDALVIANQQGEIVLVNGRAESLFGYQRDELLGNTIEMLLPERFRRQHVDDRMGYFACPQARPMGNGRVLFGRRKDGTEVPVEISLSPLETDEGVLAISAVRDISQRCQQEERLRQIEQMNAALVDSRALVETRNRQLLAANRELSEFTYVASHDLQEPLRKLRSFSNLLPLDMGGDLPEKAKQDLAFISDAAARMQVLIQDLLLLSRAGSSALRHETVDLNACADRAIEALAARIEESGAQIERDELPAVRGDATLITQLYQNLVGNAVKYRVSGRAPHIRLTAEGRERELVLGVRDDGIGIKPEYADVIFAPFNRLHGRGEYEGSGIGLAICRKVVERHGGRIWVESAPGSGAHFKFTLPGTEECESWHAKQTEQPSFSL